MPTWTEEQYQEYLKKQGKEPSKPIKKPKYNNHFTRIDGICFHSRKEAERYMELKLLLRAGEIKGFCRQPEFILVEGTDEINNIHYSADFIVFNNDGTYQIEDVKGYESEQWTRTYKQFRLKFPKLELKVLKE